MLKGRAELSLLLGQARSLVFDFDGTLVDSNPIKERAFRDCFLEFPGQLEAISRYVEAQPHLPRSEKFRQIHEVILKRPYPLSAEEALLARFDEETTGRIISAPEIPGAERFLRQVRATRMTAVLSSTPHSTLLRILNGRGWRPFFDLVQGAPVDKSSWLAQILRQRDLRAAELLFFGDTDADASAAQRVGCPFIGISRGLPFQEGIPTLPDFTDVS